MTSALIIFTSFLKVESAIFIPPAIDIGLFASENPPDAKSGGPRFKAVKP
jgi:hypothetical protein